MACLKWAPDYSRVHFIFTVVKFQNKLHFIAHIR